ncbi:hypothetical protein G6F31_017646 [Rhizopus arrhizus]|nr:hypothetical protein G6F31_017646 [Rhizopus arrhizus]
MLGTSIASQISAEELPGVPGGGGDLPGAVVRDARPVLGGGATGVPPSAPSGHEPLGARHGDFIRAFRRLAQRHDVDGGPVAHRLHHRGFTGVRRGPGSHFTQRARGLAGQLLRQADSGHAAADRDVRPVLRPAYRGP